MNKVVRFNYLITNLNNLNHEIDQYNEVRD